MAKDPLIVALDVPGEAEALQWTARLKDKVSFLKVGLELFTAAGPCVVRKIRAEGFEVFLDLKFHDIPNTVARACESAVSLGVSLLNVHASGGREMMEAAAKAVAGKATLLAVTKLTSDAQKSDTVSEVVRLAQEAQGAGLNGVVCSAQEASAVRVACGLGFVIVTPGIRFENAPENANNDQKRVMTPAKAIQAGADYIVVGRPILQASDPINVIQKMRATLPQK